MINLPKKQCFAIGWNKVDICVGRCWEIAADPPIPDMDIRSAVFLAVFESDNPNSWYSNLSKSKFSHWNVHLSWWNLHFSRENPDFSGSNLHLSRWNRHFSMVKNGVKSPLKAIPDPRETSLRFAPCHGSARSARSRRRARSWGTAPHLWDLTSSWRATDGRFIWAVFKYHGLNYVYIYMYIIYIYTYMEFWTIPTSIYGITS